LVGAFDDAVVNLDADDITVSALCRAASVNRSTFYQHFSSAEDIALQGLSELFDLVRDADIVLRSGGSPVSAAEASRRALRGLVDFLAERRDSYARLIGPSAPTQLRAAVESAFVEHSAEALRRVAVRPPAAEPVMVARFLAGGVLGVLSAWLVELEGTRSPEQVVRALLLCLPAWLVDDTRPIPPA
jgi:AcrR family transcriptional regulator